MGTQGKIYALEIGEEMREQLNQRQMKDSRIHIINQRIEQSFQLPEKASLAFISFVLHGLEQSNRLRVIENVANNLRDSGRFCISCGSTGCDPDVEAVESDVTGLSVL